MDDIQIFFTFPTPRAQRIVKCPWFARGEGGGGILKFRFDRHKISILASYSFRSFTSYSYKVGLIRTLIDRTYKINNTWLGLHEDITKLMEILKKNPFPAHLIERAVNRYISGTLSNHYPQGSLPTSPIFYFKPPYIGHFFCRNSEKDPSLYQALLQ